MLGLARAFLLLLAAWNSVPCPADGEDKKVNAAELLTLRAWFQPADPFDNHFKAGAETTAFQARPSEVVRLVLEGKPKEGYHTYPLTKRTSAQETGQLLYLTVDKKAGLLPLWSLVETEPELVKTKLGVLHYEHTGAFLYSMELLVPADATPGSLDVPLSVKGQVCNDGGCWPYSQMVSARLEVSKEKPLPLSAETLERTKQPKPEVIVVKVEELKGRTAQGATGLLSGTHEDYKAAMEKLRGQLVLKQQENRGLLAFMLAGVFWGFISLITPCVFPMIPITVSFFLKQSEKEHHRPVTLALVYCCTIILVLTFAAAFLLSAFRFLSINPIMNYALGALFIFFALSLFGMYDIELPSGLARFTSEREGKGGYAGTIFMALTFTIISFACVAPFLGGFGGTAGGTPRPFWHILLGGLAFATTFAAPFFLLALFPTMLKKLPKSGSWLNSVKVVMGFLELAAAFKFFRAAELVHTATPTFFTFDLVLGIWIALSLICGLYLLQVFRLPHDTPEDSISVPRLVFSVLFIGLAIYLLPALFKADADGVPQRPKGTVYAWIDSFLLPEARPGKGNITKTGNLEYAVNKAREERQKTGKPVRIFLDLTGKS